MSFLVRFYAKALEKNFYATHSVTAGVLYAGGDCVAQRLEKAYNVQSVGKTEYNYPRTARMLIFGVFVGGPALATWYSLLHRMTSVFRYEYVAMQASSTTGWFASMGSMYRRDTLGTLGERNREVLLKVLLDQCLFQAPYLNIYLMTMSLLEGLPIQTGWQRCRRDFHDAWSYSIIFWCPAQYFNFLMVPAQYNAFTVNFFSMLWTAFLSLLYHYRDYGHSAEHTTQDTSSQASDCIPLDRGIGEQLSEYGGLMLSVSHSAANAVATKVRSLSSRTSSALTAARIDWNASASGGTYVVLESEEHKALRDQLEEQKEVIGRQKGELEIMEKTIVAQAVRIQSLEEACDNPSGRQANFKFTSSGEASL